MHTMSQFRILRIRKMFVLIGFLFGTIAASANDVEFGFAAGFGGNSADVGHAVDTDDSGNVYAAGYFLDTTDFDPGTGTFDLTSAGARDVFIIKLDAVGDLVWAKSFGDMNNDEAWGITADESGYVYTTGLFAGTVDFDPGPGTATITSGGSADIFICKLDSDGNFVWAKALSGTGGKGWGISTDRWGNVYATGHFSGTMDFDPGAGVTNVTSAGSHDMFLSKLDSDGNLVWAKTVGGSGADYGHGAAADSSGNIHVVGNFSTTVDFDTGPGTTEYTSEGSGDVFVQKWDADGTFLWAKAFGGQSHDYGRSIALDPSGNVYTTGHFYKWPVDFDTGIDELNITPVGSEDIFVHKLDRHGNFQWVKTMGGIDNDHGYGIDVDASSNVYTTGKFQATVDFDPGAGVENLMGQSFGDVFVQKLDTDGNLLWAKKLGGLSVNYGWAIAVDGFNSVHTAGQFHGTANFHPGPGVTNLVAVNNSDIFVSKLNVSPEIISIVRSNMNPTDASTVDFAVTFSEPVSGVDLSDFVIDATGIVAAFISGVSGVDEIHTVSVVTGIGNGTLSIDLIDDDTILDVNFSPLKGSGLNNGDYTSGEVYTIDKTLPVAGSLFIDEPVYMAMLAFCILFIGIRIYLRQLVN
jgi:hypothetical protein